MCFSGVLGFFVETFSEALFLGVAGTFSSGLSGHCGEADTGFRCGALFAFGFLGTTTASFLWAIGGLRLGVVLEIPVKSVSSV